MGRPTVSDEPMATINLYITESQKNYLRQWANSRRRSVSFLIRDIIQEEIDSRKDLTQ